MMTRRRFVFTALAAAGAAAAPAAWALLGRAADGDGPPEIRYGAHRCDACGMIVSDPRFAAAARQGTTVTRYDDIGCLVRHVGAAVRDGRATAFVHDAGTEAWVAAASAAFVQSSAIRTPMNSGLAAYASAKAARAAHPGLAVLTLPQLLDLFLGAGM